MKPRRIGLLILASLLLIATACGGGSAASPSEPGLTIEVAPTEGPSPTPAPTSTPSPADLRGFVMPIVGGCLPRGDQLMPNAPRTYRKGVHEGIDFYASDSCVPIGRGTPVVAAKDGIVSRADLAYVDVDTPALARIAADPTTDEALDLYRGRQVWLDHGSGVVTRYCHLLSIAPGITPGTQVKAGQVIAFVGESGTPQSVSQPGTEYHLHWELRVGDSYLGRGIPAAEVRRLYLAAFTAN